MEDFVAYMYKKAVKKGLLDLKNYSPRGGAPCVKWPVEFQQFIVGVCMEFKKEKESVVLEMVLKKATQFRKDFNSNHSVKKMSKKEGKEKKRKLSEVQDADECDDAQESKKRQVSNNCTEIDDEDELPNPFHVTMVEKATAALTLCKEIDPKILNNMKIFLSLQFIFSLLANFK